MEVFGGVLARGLVTAADVPAGKAQPKVYPLTVRLEAFLTAFGRAGLHVMNLIQMRASCRHNCFSSMRDKLHMPRYGLSASVELLAMSQCHETGAIKA